MADNIATQIADALQTHNIDLLRIDAATRRKILTLFAELGPGVVKRIERVNPTGVTRVVARRNRLRILFDQVWELIRSSFASLLDLSNTELRDVARFETRTVAGIVNSTIGVELVSGRLTESFLRSIVSNALIEGAPSANWWRDQRDDFRDAFEREMREGVLLGESIQDLTRRVRGTRARRFQDGLMATTTRRAEALVRSSVLSVANEARFRMYQDNEDIIKGVQWLSTLDARTTDICKALDGQAWFLNGRRMPGTELPWRGPPPAHWACLPGDALIATRHRITGASKRWFDGKMITIRTTTGREITCTPNHPVLTDEGFVAAEGIDQDDRLVCDLGHEWKAPSVTDDGDDRISTIHDVTEAFFRSCKVVAGEMPTSAPDFHGDGIDNEVAYIGADWNLRPEIAATISAHSGENWFVPARLPGSVAGRGLRHLGFFFERLFAFPRRFMRCANLGVALFGRHLRPFERLRLRSTAQGDAGALQAPSDSGVADIELARKLLDRGPGKIFMDQVIDVKVNAFSGHVYNLETESGYYVAGGIITHNCRSTLVPVLRSWSELAKDAEVREKLRRAEEANPRESLRASMDGAVSGDLNYEDWLRQKDKREPGFAKEVLGPTKHALWKRGKLPFTQLVDQSHNPKTVAELEAEAE